MNTQLLIVSLVTLPLALACVTAFPQADAVADRVASEDGPAYASASITGRVALEGRAEAGGVEVRVSTKGHAVETETAPDGSYMLAGLPEGGYFVVFIAENFSPEHRTIGVVEGERTQMPDVRMVPATGSIRGRVVHEDGSPARAGVSVWAIEEGTTSVNGAVTDVEGYYRIPNLKATSYGVGPNLDGYVQRDREKGACVRATVTLGRDTEAEDIVLVAAPGTRTRFRGCPIMRRSE